MDYLQQPFVVVAKDRGIVDGGIVDPIVMTRDEYSAIPDWRKEEYTVYGRYTTRARAENAASWVNDERDLYATTGKW